MRGKTLQAIFFERIEYLLRRLSTGEEEEVERTEPHSLQALNAPSHYYTHRRLPIPINQHALHAL